MSNRKLFVYLASTFLYLLSVGFAYIDKSFSNRWIIFFIWLLSITIIPFFLLFQNFRLNNKFKTSKKELYLLLLIFVTASIFNLIFLKEYPFISIYDQVRDGGLNSAQIADGTIKNIFSYGRYESHGLIIPTITSFFYIIFKNSVFTFRFPAALLSILSSLLIYITLRKAVDKSSAFFASLVFITLPLVLYFARTEVVVVFSTFLFSVMLLFISIFLEKRKYETYIIGGLLLGFSSGFHTSIRTMAMLVLGLTILISFIDLTKTRGLKKFIISQILILLFFLIGFGPRIFFTTPDVFFQTRSFSLSNQKQTKIDYKNGFEKIVTNYKKSLGVYFIEPTFSTHYPDFKPVLNPIAGVFFLLGILLAIFWSKNKLMKLAVFFAVLIPLLNSAITEAINSDNRLGPLFVTASILTGFGIASVLEKLKNKANRIFFAILIITFFVWQGANFFFNQSASKQYSTIDYLSMRTIYFIKDGSELKQVNRICIYSNPSFYEYSKLYHVQEQFEYFLPGKYIYVAQRNEILPNEIYISKSCNLVEAKNYKKTVYCSKNEKFVCPKQSLYLYKEIGNSERTPKVNDQFFIINPTPAFIP